MENFKDHQLKLLNEQLESLTKTVTWELDLAENKINWSDRVFQILGYKPREFEVTLEKGIELIHPEDRERATTLLEDVLQNEAEYLIEKRLISKDGNIVHVRSKANLFKDKKGNPLKLIGVFQDITEFVESQEKLEEKNCLTQEIISNLPSAFFLFNKNGKMLLWNKEFEEITDYSHNEIASLAPTDFFTGEEKVKVKNHIQKVLKNGYTELEAWLTTKKNTEIPLYVTVSNIQYEGEPCVFGTGTNISHSISLLKELELLISNTEEAFMYFDQNLSVVSFNNQMKVQYELLFQKELQKGFKLRQLVRNDQKDELNQIIKQVWDKKEAKTILKSPINGEKKYYELKFKPILSKDKKVNGIFLTSLNVTETYIANIALKKSQQKLQHVLDSSVDTLCTIDENGIFQMVSRSSEQLWGYKPTELEGKLYLDYVFEEDKASTLQLFKDIQRGKVFRNFENQCLHKKGKIVPVVWSAHWNEDQNLMHCVAKDATDKLKAEEPLKFSERRFKALVQEGSDLISIVDLEGIHKYVSPNYSNILGIEPEELLGKNGFDFVHPDDQEWVFNEFSKLEKEKQIQLPPFRFRNGKGGWTWLESSISNMLEDPSVQGIVSNSRDVTERIKIENDIKEGKERLELVMKAASESIWDYDTINHKLFLGEGYLKKYGITPSKDLSNLQKHDELIHPDDFEMFKTGIINALSDPKITEWKDNYRFKKKNGEYAYVEDRAVILRDLKGNAVRAVGAIKDVSHQVLNEKLDELEKALMEESIKADKTLSHLLEDYLLGIDSLFQGMKTSILAVANQELKNLSSPGLSDEFLEEIQNLSIGPNQGSCGTAAYIKQQVVVKDIFNDEQWGDFTYLGEKFGFKSCWSEPIFNNEGEVIATFAIYHDEEKEPKDLEINIFERGARLISMMLQNYAYIESIKQNNKRFKLINKATNNAIYDWDIINDHFYWGKSLTTVFGHKKSKDKFGLKDRATWVHPEDLDEVLNSLDKTLANPHQSKWSHEYRFRYSNGKYAYVEEVAYLLRNKEGTPLRMIGALRDQTFTKAEQVKQELQYELSQVFKKELNLGEILNDSAKYLTQFGNFQAGEIWLINHNQDELYLSAYHAKNKINENFYSKRSKKTAKYGEGLVGTVWKNHKNEVWNAIDEKSEFFRKKLAQKANLKSAAAYPLFSRDKIVGVLALFSNDRLKTHDHNVLSIDNLKHFLGAEIIRKQHEEEADLFFESAPEILAIATPEGYFIKVNPAFCELLGYTQEELTTTPYADFIHPDDLKPSTQGIDELNNNEQQFHNIINRYKTKDGKYKWISWYSSNPFGQEGFVFAYGRNVSEIVALQETNENAAQLAKVGAWEFDVDRNELYWSPMVKKIYEVPEDFIPTAERRINFYHPDFRKKVAKKIRNAIDNKELFDFEALIITANNNERWVRVMGIPQYENNKCIRISGSTQDINNRKIIELRLKNLSNNIPGIIFQYHLKPNEEDFLAFVSKGSEEIFGFSPEECMKCTKKLWKNIKAGGDMLHMQESILKSAKDLNNWHAIYRYAHPDGNVYWHEGFGNPTKQPDGTVIWDSIIVDVTERKQQINAIEKQNEILQDIAWTQSHVVRAPLSRLMGIVNAMKNKKLDPQKRELFFNHIFKSAKELDEIIHYLVNKSQEVNINNQKS